MIGDLQKDLDILRVQVRGQLPGYFLEASDKFVDEATEKKLASKGLQKGDKAPNFSVPVHLEHKKAGDKVSNFSLPDARGRRVSLKDLLTKGSVVINFYRGNWCPYCNMELMALQRMLPEFKKYGSQLVAISPESPDQSMTTAEKNKLDFTVLSDLNSSVAKSFGIAYQVPDYLKKVFEKFGMDLSKHNENEVVELPIPATYVIDQNFTIRFVFANEDFTKRADVKEILKVVKEMVPARVHS